jgi:PTS system mannose-specific IIC component
MPDPAAVIALAALAGALSLDTTAVFQTMVSQPLVSAAIAGVLVGDVVSGLAVGVALELVWIGSLPVGAAAFPEAAVAAVVGTGLAALSRRAGVPASWAVCGGVLIALATGAVGQRLTSAIRALNVRLSEGAAVRVAAGDPRGLRSSVLRAIGFRFLTSSALAAVALGAGLAVLSVMPSPLRAARFPVALWAAPIGAAALAARSPSVRERILLLAGLAAGVTIGALR